MALRMGSLCSGYEGLGLAVADVMDVEHAWFAEVDPAASHVLDAHWPGTPNHGDITVTDWTTVEPVDVLTAGWPCQPSSSAGKRKGSLDERDLWPIRKFDEGGQPRRGVIDAIRALRPRTFIGENVPGLLTVENGMCFGRVLADLDDAGYTVAWTTVGACRVGLCHHRHRIYILATLDGADTPTRAPIASRDGDGWERMQDSLFGDPHPVEWPQAGHVADGQAWAMAAEPCGTNGTILPTPRANAGRTSRGAAMDRRSRSAPSLEQAVEIAQGILPRELKSWSEAPASWRPFPEMLPTPTASVANRYGMPSPETAARRMGEEGRRNLQDAVAMLPTPTARDASCGARRTSPEGRPLSEVVALLPTPTASDTTGAGHAGDGAPNLRTVAVLLPTPRASDGTHGGPNQRGSSGDLALPSAVQPERWGQYASAIRRHEQATGHAAPNPTEPGRLGRPRLTAALPEWMMGLPPGWITGLVSSGSDPRPDRISRNDAIRIAGNGVVAQAASHAIRLLLGQLARKRVAA